VTARAPQVQAEYSPEVYPFLSVTGRCYARPSRRRNLIHVTEDASGSVRANASVTEAGSDDGMALASAAPIQFSVEPHVSDQLPAHQPSGQRIAEQWLTYRYQSAPQ
jgi:hypothetical protein